MNRKRNFVKPPQKPALAVISPPRNPPKVPIERERHLHDLAGGVEVEQIARLLVACELADGAGLKGSVLSEWPYTKDAYRLRTQQIRQILGVCEPVEGATDLPLLGPDGGPK